MIARISECFGFLINGGFIALQPILCKTCLSRRVKQICTGWNFKAGTSLRGVHLKVLAQLYWFSACGSCVFP